MDRYLNSSLSTLILIFILLLLSDTNNLINVPNNIFYFILLIGFIISGVFYILYLRNTFWYKELKSIFVFLIAFILTALPLSFFLLTLFKLLIIHYDFGKNEIFIEKCLVTNVSSGKNRSLTYMFKGNTYNSKDFYYEDYRECNNHHCFVDVTVLKKPFGMYYVKSIKKKFPNGVNLSIKVLR